MYFYSLNYSRGRLLAWPKRSWLAQRILVFAGGCTPALYGLAILLASTGLVVGGSPNAKDSIVTGAAPSSSPRWTFGIGYAPLFNSSATFSNRSPAIVGAPRVPSGAVFGDYDDGFVRPDISGSSSLTTNWRYIDDSQYDPANGGSLAYTSSAAGGALPSFSRGDDDADGEIAFEIFAEIELGRIGGPSSPAAWGMHFGFHYADLDATESGVASGTATRTVDHFPLDGVIPPLAPYTGSFAGPRPLLGTNATRSTVMVPGGATISRSNDLQTDLFSLSLGPWISYAPSQRFQLRGNAGITLAFADSTYKSVATTFLPSGASASTASRASDTSLLPGFYVGGSAIYALNDRTAVYLSARYQYLDSLSLGTASSRAHLSFDESFIISTGLRFTF